MEEITLDLYKGSSIGGSFVPNKPSLEDLEKSIVSNLESGKIDQVLFCKAMEELDLIKGGKKGMMGEERTWGGKKYKKTEDGWIPVIDQKIGKTTSGKDVYSHHAHVAHKDFNEQDHKDAAALHAKEFLKLNPNEDPASIGEHHLDQEDAHLLSAKHEADTDKKFNEDYAKNNEKKAEFTEEQREKLADAGKAMPSGSFPIRNEQDLKNAIHAYGRAKDKPAAKAWIEKRAKELGKEKLLPETWE